MDSDDQNFNKKCAIDDDDGEEEEDEENVVEYKADCCNDQFDSNGNPVNNKSQNEAVNCEECDCVEVKVDSQGKSTIIESSRNGGRKKDESVMEKIMAMTLTDYGESSIICLFRFLFNRLKGLPRLESD